MCQEWEQQLYTDTNKCIRTYTVIMNHLITNQIDAIHFQIMYILIFPLLLYQSMKIYEYAKSYTLTNTKIQLQFQLILFVLSLLRISQLTYAIIGYLLDQQPGAWIEDNHQLSYCDKQFLFFWRKGICHVRYDINAFYADINLYFESLTIQMITFFWYYSYSIRYYQISPLMFISIYKVLMNQRITRVAKSVYLFFIALDLLILINQIIVFFLGYQEQAIKNLQISQILFLSFQFLFLFYTALNQLYRSQYMEIHQPLTKQNYWLIKLGILTFIIIKIVYLIINLLYLGQELVIQNYQRTNYQSILYLCMDLIVEFFFRILIIKLF